MRSAISPPSDPAGRLQIRMGAAGTTIESSRPVGAARVFVGRSPGETVRLLPTLFSICATAQSAACVGALEQAQGLASIPSVAALRRRLVDAETLREHLWRILLDWPRVLGLAPDAPAMAQVMDAYARLRAALTRGRDPFVLGPFEPGRSATAPEPETAYQAGSQLMAQVAERVLGMSPAEWLALVRGSESLASWCAETDTPAARLLSWIFAQGLADLGRCEVGVLPELDPSLCLAELGARLGDSGADDFVAGPIWNGEPRETSPLTRNLEAPLIEDMVARFGNGILTRLAVQLLEVARIASRFEGRGEVQIAGFQTRQRGAAPGEALESGVGLYQVAAARGLLVHRVRVAEGRVTDYRILAPTEWNFHPKGVVAAGLDALTAQLDGPGLEPLARLFIAAVDPCVDFDLVRA